MKQSQKSRRIIGLIALLGIGLVLSMIPQKNVDAVSTKYRWDFYKRDPFVMRMGSTYYMYGSGAETSEGGFDCWTCTDPKLNTWTGPYDVVRESRDLPANFWANSDFWAAEVHYYNGYYYMFASFAHRDGSGNVTLRGMSILRCSTPTGQFSLWSSATVPITGSSLWCYDGTFYVDQSGNPWLVYARDFNNVSDHYGEIWRIRLTSDLTATTGSATMMFKANSCWADWVVYSATDYGVVTDGPEIFRKSNGQLVMLWSSFNNDSAGVPRYSVGVMHSSNNEITGTWTSDAAPIFSSSGGHGMVFQRADGSLKLALHTPNRDAYLYPTQARPAFLDIYETGYTLTLSNPATPSYVKAYWRFEEGMPYLRFTETVDILDTSGNNNHLHGYCADTTGYATTGIPSLTVYKLGLDNRVSYNSNVAPGTGYPTRDLYCLGSLNSAAYSQWTIEASIYTTRSGYWQTFVGRDGNYNNVAPVYFKVIPDGHVWIQYIQADGTLNTCATNFTISTNTWYNFAAVCNGSTLKLYYSTGGSYTQCGSINLYGSTAMKTSNGTWTVGRGMYAGACTDQFWGYIDEVRISNAALATTNFLFYH